MKIYLLTSIGFVSFLGITIGQNQNIDLCLVEDCTIEQNLLLQKSDQVNFEGRNQILMNKSKYEIWHLISACSGDIVKLKFLPEDEVRC